MFFRFDPACPSEVIGDPFRYIQILTNLLSNAIKFTEQGRVRVDLNVSRLSGASVALDLSIADTGIGIPEDKLQSIWNEFTQLDGSSTRSYGGTGLGLTIVRSLAELMGATISVRSDVDKGSVFSVRFLFPGIQGLPLAAEVQPVLSGEIIAIASPIDEEREICEELLRAWGAHPLGFRDARSMMAAFSAPPFPRITLVDERLGSSFARELGASGCAEGAAALRGGLIVLSNLGGRAEILWRSHSPSVRFLRKPVRADALLDLLIKLVGCSKTGTAGGPPTLGEEMPSKPALKVHNPIMEPPRPQVAEAVTDTRAIEAISRFVDEADLMNRDCLPGLEFSALACRKELDSYGAKAASRLMFKIVLAYRRDDWDAAIRSIETLRTMIGARQGSC